VVVLVALAVHSLFSPRSQLFGPVFTHGSRQGSLVALTFDDGPNEPYTGQVLDILEARGVRATFFLVGENALRHPDTVRRQKALGMEIGNHGFDHRVLAGQQESELQRQVAQTQRVLEELTSAAPVWFRPPKGFRGPGLFAQTRRCGLAVAEWSNMPKDWTRPGASVIARRVLDRLRPGDIVLLHDGERNTAGADRSQTVEALPLILDGIEARGLRAVTLTELAAEGGRGLRDYRAFSGRKQAPVAPGEGDAN
jgi:peptidoglycan/xylan/chitin deacetylase (PgdA/CDA1 family)